ncbi:HipA family kinase [Vibrio alginolyticus]|uniref:HipA family kinase n=1 Tax=Vibrio alginolyticus TaxID=663 RepID=UPI002119E4A0|nr:HipA family kinase [Vibrio alginolyticus]MCQ9087400.1 hypothetical protein [Vibrio alginolyticus]
MCDIDITKIVEPMKQGYTKPYLCEASNGKKYVVKGLKATCGGLVREWIIANIGKRFGLNIPPFHLAFLDNHLDGDHELVDSEIEICFASEYISGAKEIQYSMLGNYDPEALRELYFFDYWIRNDDRCLSANGGNANLFVHPSHQRPFVLDHNLSLEANFDITKHKSNHLAASIWDEKPDLVCFDDYKHRIEISLKDIDSVINSLPEEWLERYPRERIEEEIVTPLLRYKTDEFWEAIK